MYKLALICVSFFVLISPANAAGKADEWLVTQLSGDARVVHQGFQPASLTVNSAIAPGDMLVTGPNGRATLVRGGDYIVVAPRSELRLPSAPQPARFTRVMQTLGTLLFKVRHTGIPHFAVDTPTLAAVVKGTTFTVIVDRDRSAVQVIEGRVQVSTIDGAMSRMVEGGKTVFVNHDKPNILFDADKPAPASAPSSSIRVEVAAAGDTPLTAISSLTGGLVRADLSTPPSSPVGANVVMAALTDPAPKQASTTTPSAAIVSSTPVASTGITTPAVTAPSVTTPSVTVAAPTSPTVAAVATPAVTVPSITTPTVTTPAVTTPTVTVPSITVPAVTIPTVTAPTLTTPTVVVPSISVPSVITPQPVVTTPAVTVPSVSLPVVPLVSGLLSGLSH
jgi:hypothetical protein